MAIVVLTIIGTSMHFVHHLPFFNHFLGYIFPVQESVMAHTKMVFYPSLLLSLYLVISRRDIREIGAPVLGGLAMAPAIIACFFAYWVFVRHEIMALDMIIYILAMTGFILLANRLRRLQFVRRAWPLWTILILIVIFLTGLLTYHYPEGWLIFADLGLL